MRSRTKHQKARSLTKVSAANQTAVAADTLGISPPSCNTFPNYVALIGFLDPVRTCLLRGAIVNRIYGVHKNLNIQAFLLTIFGPVNYGPP